MQSVRPRTPWLACLLLAAMLSPDAWAQRQHLRTGESIVTGQYLQSTNKKFYAVMQADGNLCVYAGTPDRPTGNLWCHHRTAPGGQFVTVMQSDGNLCTYSGTPAAFQKLSWCTNAVSPGGQYVLVQQDDGNLCVYRGTPTQYEKNLWCHNTGMATSSRPLAPAKIGTGDSCFDVTNNSEPPRTLWITVYGVSTNLTNPNPIIGTGCLQPGQAAQVGLGTCGLANAIVRGELTKNANCQHPVDCDTKVNMKDLGERRSWQSMRFRSNPQTCWWDFQN